MVLPSKPGELWVNKYAPRSISDLAIHKKKIEEVMNWIGKSFTSHLPSILLLTGPSGCGKTSTLYAMPNIEISTWNDDSDLNSSADFTDFLLKSRYSEVDDSHLENKENINKKLILIEGFPYEFYNEPSNLHNLLIRYKSTGKYPLVIIISDSQSMKYSQHWLVPKSLQTQLKIDTIAFNPIAFTFMKKCLQSIIKAEAKYSTEKQQQDIIKNLSQISDGDIRSAINNLQILLTAKERSLVDRQDQMNKDHPLFLFRALGKILYCKREVDEGEIQKSRKQFESSLPQSSDMFRAPLLFSPENVFDSCSIDYLTFVGYLHENYLDFIEDIDQISQISDDLSLSESLFNRWLPETEDLFGRYLVSVATRSIMFHNESRPKNTFRALRKSSLPALWKKMSSMQSTVADLCNGVDEHSLFNNRAVMNSTTLLCDILPGLSKMACRKPELSRKLSSLGVLDQIHFTKKSIDAQHQLRLEDDGVPVSDDLGPVLRISRKEEKIWAVCSEINEDNVVITVDD